MESNSIFVLSMKGFEFEFPFARFKLRGLKFKKSSSHPHLKNLQIHFTMSKPKLKIILKRKNHTTLTIISIINLLGFFLGNNQLLCKKVGSQISTLRTTYYTT
jgi:hypothetical protein